MAKEKHFDVVASAYNEKSRKGLWGWLKSREMRAVVEEIKSQAALLDDQPVILDVGCGSGLYANVLGKEVNAVRIVGVDSSESMLQQFRKLGHEGCRLDLEKELLPEGKYDIITLLGVLEFVKDLSQLRNSLGNAVIFKSRVVVLVPELNFLNLFYYLYHRMHGNTVYLRSHRSYLRFFAGSGYRVTRDFKVTPISRLLVFESINKSKMI